MSAVEKTVYPVVVNDWRGLYGESWAGDLVAEAYQHPAKYSRALIRKIYAHAAEEGWIRPGSTIVDPFGGIAGGALDAMLSGCHWHGCELESRFVELGQRNIDLWQSRYSRMPSWGTAELRQGDSRRLANLFSGAQLAVGSPPFGAAQSGGGIAQTGTPHNGTHSGTGGYRSEMQGDTPGNLAALPATEEGFDCAISSPPYASETVNGRNGIDPSKFKEGTRYGRNSQAVQRGGYGESDGQLGEMKFDAAISSPPFERQIPQQDKQFTAPHDSTNNLKGDYGRSDGQLGITSGEDFWQASRLILEQLYSLLTPGGHAVFVTKRFVRRKQVVEFSAQWAALCEAVGFRQLHRHRCWLVESHGAQGHFDGGLTEMTTERKSFFRRLAEKKGSPRIDYEDCLCFVKETP